MRKNDCFKNVSKCDEQNILHDLVVGIYVDFFLIFVIFS